MSHKSQDHIFISTQSQTKIYSHVAPKVDEGRAQMTL